MKTQWLWVACFIGGVLQIYPRNPFVLANFGEYLVYFLVLYALTLFIGLVPYIYCKIRKKNLTSVQQQ